MASSKLVFTVLLQCFVGSQAGFANMCSVSSYSLQAKVNSKIQEKNNVDIAKDFAKNGQWSGAAEWRILWRPSECMEIQLALPSYTTILDLPHILQGEEGETIAKQWVSLLLGSGF